MTRWVISLILLNMSKTNLDKCEVCKKRVNIDDAHMPEEGIFICDTCWPDYAEENGLCQSCGSELEPIYENNGFTPPDGPPHWDIAGYKPCTECRDDSNDRDDEE